MIVGIEQHKRLRKLGFPMVESCKDATTGQDVIYKFPMPYNEVQMRLPKLRGDINVHEALDWIREDKNIPCAVMLEFEADLLQHFYYGEYSKKQSRTHSVVENTATFDTHPLAESALLDDLLTYLEENNHGNK